MIFDSFAKDHDTFILKLAFAYIWPTEDFLADDLKCINLFKKILISPQSF